MISIDMIKDAFGVYQRTELQKREMDLSSRELTSRPKYGVWIVVDQVDGQWRFAADLAYAQPDGSLMFTNVFGVGPKGERMPIGNVEVQP